MHLELFEKKKKEQNKKKELRYKANQQGASWGNYRSRRGRKD